jgi:transcriptional regulator with XRE-family HTH domain
MAVPSGARRGLGKHLKDLRERAGMSGTELARALGSGWQQPKVSRIESGAQLPSVADVEAWARAVGADPGPLLALRGKASAEYAAYGDRVSAAGGPAALQDRLGALEASCQLLAEYQPGFIPGLLQTPSYMREMADGEEFLAEDGITPDTLGQLFAAKVRRGSLLHEGTRRIVHVVGEAALHTRVGRITTSTMRAQLEHLASLAALPGHEFGVIPLTTPTPVAPASGFRLFDTDMVIVETLAGELAVTDPQLVARYVRWLDLLLGAAVTGQDAAARCRQIAAAMS